MDPTIEVIKQDLNVALTAFGNKDFSFVGIIGNRIMTNVLLGDQLELMPIGYFLKEVAAESHIIFDKDDTNLSDYMSVGSEFISNIISVVNENKFYKEIWDFYYQYEKEAIKAIPKDVESLHYKENIRFTNITTNKLKEHLIANKDLLLLEENALLVGVLNEEGRVINTHGFDEQDIAFYMVLKAFHNLYRYQLEKKNIGQINENEFKEEVFDCLEQITNLPEDIDALFERCNKLLVDFGEKTRINYINYLDPGAVLTRVEEKQNIIIPDKSREKIGKFIEDAIESEVKK